MSVHTLEVFISASDVGQRVAELGEEISKDYKCKDLLTLSVLKGSVIFTADIVRCISVPVEMRFIAVSSYGSRSYSSGDVKINYDIDISVEGKDVLIVEDIVDSGNTLSFLRKLILERGAASVKICTLLDKPSRRKVDIHIDYIGFKVPDKFIVGYGLDFDNKYRNLKDICVIEN